MVSTEEILITMMGKNEVTPVVNQIQGDVNSAFSNMSSNAQASASSIGQAYQSVFDQIGQGLSALNQGMMGISSANSMVLNQLGATKSAMDYVYGTTAKADTNKVLVRSWGDAKTTWEDIYDTIDHVTDNSLTSMQDLIPAMNAFKASTNATGTQLKDSVAEDMAQFGAYVLALTGSEQLSRTAMTDLSKGLVGKGAFSALDQYGVTKESLMARGWSGKNEDIEGYMNAVRQVSGQVEDLMDTSEGLDAQLGKMWSRAGKKIGNEMLPGMKSLKVAFMELDEELDNNLSTTILRVSLGIEEAQQKLYIFNTLWQGVKNISEAFNTLKVVLGFTKVEQEANNLMQQENNRMVEESNLLLAENNDLRLANAEAMGMQNLGMQGYNPYEGMDYGDAMQYAEMGEGGMEDSWGGDVLANTAGGLLESKYDRVRHGGGNSGVSKENVERLKKDLELIKEEKGITTRYNDALIDLTEAEAQMSNTANDVSKMTETGMYGTTWFNALNRDSKLAENIIEDLEKQNISTTKKMEKFGEGTGPFNKLSIWLNEKKKRKLPSFDTDIGLSSVVSSFRSRIGGGLTNLKTAFSDISTRFNQFKDLSFADKLDNVWSGLSNSFRNIGVKMGIISAESTAIATEAEATAVTNGVASEAMGVTATEAGAMAVESEVAGAEMTVAETGVTWMGLAESGLAGAFTTLIVPTLAIAGVIAVLIPVVAGLVAEAIFFINLIGQFMSSLQWNFDVSSAIESISQLAIALAWLGVAMASMSFAGLLTAVAFFITGFGQVEVVLGTAVDMLKEAVGVINEFGDSAQVNPSVADNLARTGEAINGVSLALMSLIGTRIVANIGNLITLNGALGSLSSTFREAKTDLQNAITEINSMNFQGIDEGKINQIKAVMEAIGAFADAFSGLNDIRNTMNVGNALDWLLNLGGSGHSIKEAFQSAHDDIVQASEALGTYTDIPNIDQSLVEKITTVCDAIGSFADAFEGLRKIRDNTNWDSFMGGIFPGQDIGTTFANVKSDLENISKELANIKISPVPEGLDDKITNIINVLDSMNTAVNNMKAIGETGGNKAQLDKAVINVQQASSSIVEVSKVLQNLGGGGEGGGISNVSADLSERLTKMSDALNALLTVVNSAMTFPQVNKENVGTNIDNAVQTVVEISGYLGNLTNITGGTENIPTVLTNIGNGLSSLRTVTDKLLAFPIVDKATTGMKIKNAVDSVKNASTELKNIGEGDRVGEVQSIIDSVTNAVNALKSSIQAMSFNGEGTHIGTSLKNGINTGLGCLTNVVHSRVSSAGAGSGAWTVGKNMGTSLTNGFRTGLDLVNAINTEIDNLINTINNRIPDVSGAMSNLNSASSTDSEGESGGSLDMGWDSVARYSMMAKQGLVDMSRVTALSNMSKSSNTGSTQTSPTHIVISEGAVKVDANNLTKKESRQVMINALEGLSTIKNIETY